MRSQHPGFSRMVVPVGLLSGFLWAGCAQKPPLPVKLPGEAGVQASYEARCVVHIQHEGSAKRSAQARWVSGPGGSLLIAARYGPLVPLLTLAANPDSLQLLLPRQNAYGVAGRMDPLGEDESDVTFDDVVHWLRGVLEPHGLPSRLHRPRVVLRGTVEVLRGLADGPSGRIVSEVWRDLETGRIRKWSLDETEGRRLLLVEYPEDAWSGDALLPKEIRLFWPVERLAALIVLQRSQILDPPPPPTRFALDPPRDARRGQLDISWKEVLE